MPQQSISFKCKKLYIKVATPERLNFTVFILRNKSPLLQYKSVVTFKYKVCKIEISIIVLARNKLLSTV